MRVYIDGACKGNHDRNLRIAAYGIWLPSAQRGFFGPIPRGYGATNNVAEAYALLTTLKMAARWNPRPQVLHVHTDSTYVMQVFERVQRGLAVKSNTRIWQLVQTAWRNYVVHGGKVELTKVRAHATDVDNNMADKMANLGCQKFNGVAPAEHVVERYFHGQDPSTRSTTTIDNNINSNNNSNNSNSNVK